MLNFKTFACIIVGAVLSTINGYSQKESVILYNSQAVKVELSETGNIKSFIGLVPGYMFGYNLTPSFSVEPMAVKEENIPTGEVQNAGYAIISSEKIDLQYKPYFATLDKSTINILNDVSARLKLNPKLKILITAHTNSNNESKLSSNRLASAIAYLGIKGINPNRIQTETHESKDFVDILSINYLN